MNRLFVWMALGAWLASLALPAQAYLDPASGSMFLQLLLGGVAGAALAVKLYWHKILGLFGVKKQETDDPTA